MKNINQFIETLSFERYNLFVQCFFLGLFIILFSYSYIQTEILTAFNLQNFDLVNICKTTERSDFKYAKLIKYEKFRRNAQIDCIYQDAKKNTRCDLNYNNQWQVFTSKKLNQDKAFYWPIYI